MQKKIALISKNEKNMYTLFFFVILALFIICTAYTKFNILSFAECFL